jgi:hypothetical protein
MTTTTSERRFVTFAGAAALSGMSQESLRRLARAGRLVVYRPTCRPLLDAEELTQFIRQHRSRPEA